MSEARKELLFEGDTELEHYQVVEMVYEGRPARILFSGHRSAAQSGLPLDGRPEPLFDYNKRFLELAIGLQPTSVLVIGGGAFTLPLALLEHLPEAAVDVVELDAGLSVIAEGFFGLREDVRMRILHGDGSKYLASTDKHYDLILVDVFMHDVIPRAFMAAETTQHLSRCLDADGVVAMNVIATQRGHRSHVLEEVYGLYKAAFPRVRVFPADRSLSEWQPQNYLLVTETGKTDAAEFLRFPAISLDTNG